MNEKLTNSDLFQAIFESSLAGLFVVDDHGSILSSNHTADSIFGYEDGELTGKLIKVVFPQWRKRVVAAHSETEIEAHQQSFGHRKDGVKFPIDFRIVPTKVKGQSIKVIYCKPADISVFESDRKFRTLVSNVAGIVYGCQICLLYTSPSPRDRG